MATNSPNDGGRKGAIKERSQVFNPQNQKFVKRDRTNGQFIDVKSNINKFKGVRTEGGKK